jgi:hypothetical protein
MTRIIRQRGFRGRVNYRAQGSGGRNYRKQTAESRQQGTAEEERAVTPGAVNCFLLSAFCLF